MRYKRSEEGMPRREWLSGRMMPSREEEKRVMEDKGRYMPGDEGRGENPGPEILHIGFPVGLCPSVPEGCCITAL